MPSPSASNPSPGAPSMSTNSCSDSCRTSPALSSIARRAAAARVRNTSIACCARVLLSRSTRFHSSHARSRNAFAACCSSPRAVASARWYADHAASSASCAALTADWASRSAAAYARNASAARRCASASRDRPNRTRETTRSNACCATPAQDPATEPAPARNRLSRLRVPSHAACSCPAAYRSSSGLPRGTAMSSQLLMAAPRRD